MIWGEGGGVVGEEGGVGRVVGRVMVVIGGVFDLGEVVVGVGDKEEVLGRGFD